MALGMLSYRDKERERGLLLHSHPYHLESCIALVSAFDKKKIQPHPCKKLKILNILSSLGFPVAYFPSIFATPMNGQGRGETPYDREKLWFRMTCSSGLPGTEITPTSQSGSLSHQPWILLSSPSGKLWDSPIPGVPWWHSEIQQNSFFFFFF